MPVELNQCGGQPCGGRQSQGEEDVCRKPVKQSIWET